MQLPQIRMQSTFIQTGLNIQEPVQRIQQPSAIVSIEQPQAELRMQTTPGKLTIDQTKAREDVDLKSVFKRTEEAAQKGRQDWLNGLARRARQGQEMRHIENGGNVIAAHAKQNSKRPEKQFNIGWIPSPFSVKLHYQAAKVNIEATPHKPIIDVKIQEPIHEYIPGDVNVSVEQKNSLNIDFVNL